MGAHPARDDLAGLASLDDPLRRSLYDYVCAQAEPVGREQAAAAAGISRSLAAYHLDKLAGHGLLEITHSRPAGRSGPGAGRPAKLYARAAQELAVSLPARDYALAALLLAEAIESDSSGRSRARAAASARRLGRRLGSSAPRSRGGARGTLVRVLGERGYEPFEDDGAIRLRNCPFHAIVALHRDTVCAMNLALLRGLAEGLDLEELRLDLDPRSGCCCVAVRGAA